MISVLRIRCPFLSRHKDNNCRVTHSANLSWQQHRMSVLRKYSLQFCYCLKWKILFSQQIIVTRNTCADYFIFIQQFIEWHVHKSGVVCICFSVAAEVADFCSEKLQRIGNHSSGFTHSDDSYLPSGQFSTFLTPAYTSNPCNNRTSSLITYSTTPSSP